MNGKYELVCVGGAEFYKHRLVWELAHGPIPAGYHVHHKDDNPRNNSIDNLELLPKAEHHRRHGRTRDMDKVRAGRKPAAYACTSCGISFIGEARHKARNHFCSVKCQNKHYNAIHNTPEKQRVRKAKRTA